MEITASILTWISPSVDLNETVYLWGQRDWSVTGVLAQGRGGEETPILSSP